MLQAAQQSKREVINLNLFLSADPLVGSIATQYTQNREEHDRIAKLWTKRYAT
jgi:hypothetical protein